MVGICMVTVWVPGEVKAGRDPRHYGCGFDLGGMFDGTYGDLQGLVREVTGG